IAESLGDVKSLAESWNHLGLVSRMSGHDERGRDEFERALALFRECGDARGIAATAIRLGVQDLRCERHDAAHRLFMEALDVSRSCGDRVSEAMALTRLGRLAHRESRLELARELYERALEIHTAIGSPLWQVHGETSIAALETQRGNLDAADAHCRRAVQIAESLEHVASLADALHVRGSLDIERGSVASGVRTISTSLNLRRTGAGRLPPHEQRRLDALLERARAVIGAEFESAWAAGETDRWQDCVRRISSPG
ncbi:MAG: tetratricopeptide repeat protein, partial [Planctomycetes bacterium]|nr:tetratricopeptide repeat protein [Planctomycetota bacterium]